MTAKLELFKNLPFDGVLTLPKFSSLSAQNTYFDSYTDKISISSFRANKIMEPILVSYDYDTLSQYPYGRIKFNSVWYYFIVSNLTVINDDKIQILYTLDSWTTAFYQYALAMKNCHVIRKTTMPSIVPSQDINAIRPIYTEICKVEGPQYHGVFFTATRQNSSGQDYLIYGMLDNVDNSLLLAESNLWDEKFGIQPSTIKNVWYVPNTAFQTFVKNSGGVGWTNEGSDGYGKGGVYTCANSYYMPLDTSHNFSKTYTCDDLHNYTLLDSSGSIIWSCPFGKSFDRMYMTLEMTTNYCDILVEFRNGNENGHNVTVKGMSCKVSCVPIDFFIDSYSEYASGYRQLEIKTRQVQNAKASASAIAGGIQTGAIGAISGAGPLGAVAGVSSALVQIGVNYAYEGKEQALKDKEYQLNQDAMITIGNSLTQIVGGLENCLSLYEITPDSYTIQRYNNKISTYGYNVNEYYNDSSWFTAGYFVAQCEITGNCPMDWKNAIASKFANGIRIVSV